MSETNVVLIEWYVISVNPIAGDINEIGLDLFFEIGQTYFNEIKSVYPLMLNPANIGVDSLLKSYGGQLT